MSGHDCPERAQDPRDDRTGWERDERFPGLGYADRVCPNREIVFRGCCWICVHKVRP